VSTDSTITRSALLVCEGLCRIPTRHIYAGAVGRGTANGNGEHPGHYALHFSCVECRSSRVWGTWAANAGAPPAAERPSYYDN
jgi:hypothetical protein